MSAWLILTVSLIYLAAGVIAAGKSDYGLVLFCLGCVIANIGIAMMARG